MEKYYRRSKGNAGLDGVQFQVSLSTVFLLNATRNLKGWRISTENEAAGKFDDIVIELSDGTAVLLQAKHKDCKRINKDQLLSDNSKNADFSLPKYFFSYQEIKPKFNVKKIILCTNADVDTTKLKDFFLHQCVDPESILYCEGVCSRFMTLNDKILAELRENSEVYYEKNLKGKSIDKGVLTEENLKDFLDKLQLFTGYPSKSKLNECINKLLSRLTNSKLWTGVSSQEIYGKVEDWFKHGRGEYLNETLTNAMFCEIKNNKYCKTLKDYNVSFDSTDISFPEGKRIFHIDTHGAYLLQAIKTYYALQEKKAIFVNPEDEYEVHKLALDAFKINKYEFLILILPKLRNQDQVAETKHKLEDILHKYSYKKVVIIGSKELVHQLNLKDITAVDCTPTWSTLTKQCRDGFVSKKHVTFQGQEMSLEQLLPGSKVEDYDKAVQSTVIEKLVKGEHIQVGKQLLKLDGNIAKYYISRRFEREVDGGEKKEVFTEVDILEMQERAIIISDSAGMGKSTVLAKLATDMKERHPHLWVIRIELNEYSKFLMNTLKKNQNTITLRELLDSSPTTRVTNELEEYLMSMPGKVVLMLDGFDEISPDYTDLILSLVTQCYDSPEFAKIVITTRPHMSLDLEEVLKVKPFMLQPFTKQDQIAFLTSYWENNLELDWSSKVRCETYAFAFISKMSSWISGNNNFAAIPLQVLAEIFQENLKWNDTTDWEGCKEFVEGDEVEPLLPERMKIIKLFDMFIDKKLDIFLDKANPSGTATVNLLLSSHFNKYLENHKNLALKVVLGKENVQDQKIREIFSRFQYNKEVETEMLKIGVVQEAKGEIEFVHRTFVEYFAAKSIVDISELHNLAFNQDVYFQMFFIDLILCNNQCSIIRSFLESILEDLVDSLPCNILENYQCNATGDSNSRVQRSHLIHLLAKEGCLSIMRMLLKCINHNMNLLKIKRDENCKRCNSLVLLQSFIETNGINIKDDLGNTPLHYACREGHLDVVKYLVYDSSIKEESVTIVDDLKLLEQHTVDVNVAGHQGLYPLHLASRQGHMDVVKFLEEHGAKK